MNSTNLVFSILIYFAVNISYGQNLSLGFQSTYGGSNQDILQKSVKTSDNGFICIGSSSSGISGDKTENTYGFNDYWVVKFDLNLNVEWQKTIGGNQGESGITICETPEGNFILGGTSSSGISGIKTTPNLGSDDYWIVKLSSTGNFLWDASFGGTGTDILNSIQIDSLGNIYLGGQSNSDTSATKSEFSKGSSDYWILKLDSTATIIWDKTIGGSALDVMKDFLIQANGEIVMYGISTSNISGDKSQNSFNNSSDMWVLKLNSSGSIIWDKTIGGDDLEGNGFSIIYKDNYYYMVCPTLSGATGLKTEPSQGLWDSWVVKIDENGNMIWDKTIGGSGTDSGNSLTISSHNQILISGGSDSNISGDKTENSKGGTDGWIVAIDTASNILWQKTIGGSQYDLIKCSHEVSPGNYLLACYSSSNISGDKTENSRGLEDYWFVELQTDLSAMEVEANNYFSIFPNPSNQYLNIQFNTFNAGEKIEIYDCIGQLIFTSTINENITIDISNWSNGIYFVFMEGNAQKFIVNK